MNSIYPWDTIREQFINGMRPSEILEQWGMGRMVLYRRMRREGWKALRKEREAVIAARAKELLIEQRAHEFVDAAYVCDRIIRSFLEKMDRGEVDVTLNDAMSALKFREVLSGGVSDRNETNSNVNIRQMMLESNVSVEDIVQFLSQVSDGELDKPAIIAELNQANRAAEDSGSAGTPDSVLEVHRPESVEVV
jgi:hypothetical protein